MGVLAVAIIGMVAWVLSIDRRTRGMVDSLEQERRKVAEMQVFLSRRGNDGARRSPRAPQSGAAVGARAAGGEGAAAAGRPQAAAAPAGEQAAQRRWLLRRAALAASSAGRPPAGRRWGAGPWGLRWRPSRCPGRQLLVRPRALRLLARRARGLRPRLNSRRKASSGAAVAAVPSMFPME